MNAPSIQDIGAEWVPSVNPWLITLAVMLPTFLEVLDTTIVAVALPNIAGSMGSTNNEATWVLTSYLVANAVVLPASGWLAMRFGRKRFLLFCIALFTLATFLCGLAWSMPVLILARILQGAGGGALMPLSQAILLESFPREKQGMAMAMFGLGVVGAPIIGPILGGWLTDNYSWRWAFNFKIPFAILAIYLIAKYIEDPPYIRNARPGTIDGIGFGLLTVWLATLQIVLDKGQQQDWFASAWIVWFSIVSVAALAALIVRELRTPEPLVDLRVFRDRNFWDGTVTTTVVMAAMYSVLTMLPLFLQTLLGYKSQSAGLAIAPLGIGAMIAMPIVGILMSYVDGRWLMSLGIALLTIAMFRFGNLTLDISMASIGWPGIIPRPGYGICYGPSYDHVAWNACQREDWQRQRNLQSGAQPGRKYRHIRLHDIPAAHDTNPPGESGHSYDAIRSGISAAALRTCCRAKPVFRRTTGPHAGICAAPRHAASAS